MMKEKLEQFVNYYENLTVCPICNAQLELGDWNKLCPTIINIKKDFKLSHFVISSEIIRVRTPIYSLIYYNDNNAVICSFQNDKFFVKLENIPISSFLNLPNKINNLLPFI